MPGKRIFLNFITVFVSEDRMYNLENINSTLII